jgi:hypothetical protein
MNDLDLLLEDSQGMTLDDLMAESTAAAALRVKAKELKARQKRGDITADEFDANAAMLRKWELEREWIPLANVLVFHRQTCSHCGSTHNNFGGFYEKHQHTKWETSTRQFLIKRIERKELPKLVEYRDEFVGICHTCADAQDVWELEEDNNEQADTEVFENSQNVLRTLETLAANNYESSEPCDNNLLTTSSTGPSLEQSFVESVSKAIGTELKNFAEFVGQQPVIVHACLPQGDN